MRYVIACLKACIIQFSRIPLGGKDLESSHFSQSINYLPFFGLLLGLFAGILSDFLAFYFSNLTVAIFTSAILLLITGAIHEDGFADCCDGFFGAYDKEKRLTIMKDSRLGTFGVLGLIFLVLLKVSLLAEISPERLLSAWVLIQSFSRITPLIIVLKSNYVVSESNVSKMTASVKPSFNQVIPVIIVTLLFNMLLLPVTFVAINLLCIVILSALSIKYFNKKISGYNGDCLGASQQVAECLLIGIFIVFF